MPAKRNATLVPPWAAATTMPRATYTSAPTSAYPQVNDPHAPTARRKWCSDSLGALAAPTTGFPIASLTRLLHVVVAAQETNVTASELGTRTGTNPAALGKG